MQPYQSNFSRNLKTVHSANSHACIHTASELVKCWSSLLPASLLHLCFFSPSEQGEGDVSLLLPSSSLFSPAAADEESLSCVSPEELNASLPVLYGPTLTFSSLLLSFSSPSMSLSLLSQFSSCNLSVPAVVITLQSGHSDQIEAECLYLITHPPRFISHTSLTLPPLVSPSYLSPIVSSPRVFFFFFFPLPPIPPSLRLTLAALNTISAHRDWSAEEKNKRWKEGQREK